MKLSKYLLLLFFFVVLCLGCDRTDMDMETVTVPVVEPTNEYVGDPPNTLLEFIKFLSPCIDEIVFPVELNLDDGTTKVVNDMSLLDQGCNCINIDLVYPVEVIDQDGTTQSFQYYWDIYDEYMLWASSQTSNDAFLEFVYPVTFVDDNTGGNFIAENYNEVITIINDVCD